MAPKLAFVEFLHTLICKNSLFSRRRCLYTLAYLPHEGVVVVGFDLARVDLLAAERSELRALGDDGFLAEDAVVHGARKRRLGQIQTCDST